MRLLVLAETAAQARAALACWPDSCIVSMTPAVDAFAIDEGLDIISIEEIADEERLANQAPAIADRVEALSRRVTALASTLLVKEDPFQDLTLRSYYHNLRTHLDGLVVRAHQVAAAFDWFKPTAVGVFGPPPYAMSGFSCLDKPPLGLTQRLLARLAALRGLAVERISRGCLDIPDETSVEALLRPLGSGERFEPSWLTHLAQILHLAQNRLKAKVVAQQTKTGPVHLVSSLFSDLGNNVGQAWCAAHGPVLGPEVLCVDAIPAADIVQRVVIACDVLMRRVEADRVVEELLTWRSIDLRPEFFSLLGPVIRERFPAMWADGKRFEAWFARNRAVVLLGGLVDSHYILARVAGRHGAPVVSYKFGGFVGFALLPIHERYDMAEADYILCGGPLARRTLITTSPEARWPRRGLIRVKRARPVPLGLPWVSTILREARAAPPQPKQIRRVMVVLNAILGDCRYLGRVFPPEIGYWRFTRDLITRLAQENLTIIVKPPLDWRYPQLANPVEAWIVQRQSVGEFGNVSILRDKRLTSCLQDADAFLIESPSTPLVELAATRAAIGLFIDREVYRLVPEAAGLLRRRCAVFGEDRETFFAELDSWLWDVCAGNATTGGAVDDAFLEAACMGRNAAVSGEAIASFLAAAAARHPIPNRALAALGREA